MRQYFHQSIARKVALFFLLLVTLPVLLLSFIFYHNYARQITEQAIKDRSNAVRQLSGNLETTLLSLDNLSRDLVYRSNVISLLHRPDLNKYPILSAKYTEQIVLAVKYSLKYQRLGIEDVCIYADNETVKEQSYFYRSARLQGLDCYDRFVASGQSQQLYLLNMEEAQDYAQRKGERALPSYNSALYMRRMYENDDKPLGVLVFEFAPAQLFHSVLSEPGYFVILNEGSRIYGAAPEFGVPEAIEAAPSGASLAEVKGQAHPFDRIDGFDVVVSTNEAVNRRSYDIRALHLSGMIGLLALIQLALLFLVTKHIFKRINSSISAMDDIVRGGYRGHVPVRGDDELAQVATRYNTVLDHVDELVAANVEKETAHKTAQIMALQYQMNPHFIYNTLTVFSGQAEKEGNYELSDAISYFGQMLRYNIQGKSLYATVEKELTNARSMFKVYELKYPDRMKLEIEASPEVLNLPVIKFVIQPLLENSILHGRHGKSGTMTVRIRFAAKGNVLCLTVEDDGVGIDPERLRAVREGEEPGHASEKSSSFIGLKNIRDRIRLFYGEEASFDVDSELSKYTRVTIRLPIRAIDAQALGEEARQ